LWATAGLVEVQSEPSQGSGARDTVDKTSTALEFSDHCGGARPVAAVDHQVGVERVVAIQPGLQQSDKIVAVAGSQYNCHGIGATPNHL
jgi:hypothetical protein